MPRARPVGALWQLHALVRQPPLMNGPGSDTHIWRPPGDGEALRGRLGDQNRNPPMTATGAASGAKWL